MNFNYSTRDAFNKIAIEKGLISEKTDFELEKIVAKKKQLLLTDNLFLNYAGLISELNKQGMFDQASNLSKAIDLFKNAETHLYHAIDEEGQDLLDFAHEGNVEIIPAANREGEIETLDSQHQKILNTLSHPPTGKYAEAIKFSILTTGQALGIDLLKFAQTGDIDVELMDQDIAAKINQANSQIAKILTANQDNFQNALDKTGLIDKGLAEWLDFTQEKLFKGQGLSFFLKANKIPAENFNKFKVAYENLSSQGEISAENIAKIIYGLKTFEGNLAFFQAVDGTIADKFFGGSNIIGIDKEDSDKWNEINTKAASDPKYKIRPDSIWDLSFKWLDKQWFGEPKLSMNSGKVGSVAEAIFNWIKKWKDQIINDDTLNKARQEVINSISPIKDSIVSIQTALEPKQFLATNKISTTTGIAVGNLQTINAKIDESIKDLNKYGEVYNSLGYATIPEQIAESLNAAKLSNGRLIEILNGIQINPVLDSPVSGDLQNQIMSTFRQIATIWHNYFKNGQLSDEDRAIVENNRNQAFGVFSTMKNHANKPYGYILRQISAWFPKAQTPEQLAAIGEEGLQYAKSTVPAQFQVQASLKNEFVKNADDTINNAYSYCLKIIHLIQDLMKNIGEHDIELKELHKFEMIKDIIYANIKNPFEQWRDKIPNPLYPNSMKFTTKENFLDQIKKYYKLWIDLANYKGLKKQADFGKLPGKPGATSKTAPAKPGLSGKSTSIGTSQQGLKKFDANDPSQVAVAQMQLALNNLGRLVSDENNKAKFPKLDNYDANDGLKIIGTGPKSNPHLNMFDGVWGTNTNNALILAQKYIGSLGGTLQTGVKWNPATKTNASGTEDQAKTNISLINKVNNYLSGQRGTEGQQALPDTAIFDTLPKTINWNLEVGPAQATFDKAEIPVSKGNLSSLQAFYDFLTSSGIKEPETSGESAMNIGNEGFLPKTWNESLQWFVKRAVLKYDSLKNSGKEALNNAREYYNAANGLWNQYKRMLATYLKTGKIKADEVINQNLIAEFSKGAGKAGISDQTGTGGSRYKRQPETSEQSTVQESAAYGPTSIEGEGLAGREGFRSKSPEDQRATLPFSDVINFRDEDLWSDFDASNLSSPVLRLADFQKVPGQRMAQFLFAGSSAQEAQKLAIQQLGGNPVQWDPKFNEWMLYASPDKKILLPASRMMNKNNIDNLAQQYINIAPINQYRKFLGNLQAKLANVMQEWSQEAPEELIVHLTDYYKYWQQAIAKQARDLQRIRT